jgi:hypothetical protein
MNLNQLTDALSHDDARPATVLSQLNNKRRSRRRRHALLGSAATVVAVATIAAIWLGTTGHLYNPDTGGELIGTNTAGCASGTITQQLTEARESGASIITATSVLTGKTAVDGVTHHEMKIDQVQTLAGPAVANGTNVWIAEPLDRPTPDSQLGRFGEDPGPLWGPGGALFGIVWPQKLNNGPLGTTIRHAPLVDDQVILSASGCWNARGVKGTPYRGPLAELPGFDSAALAAASPGGLTAVPLTTMRRLSVQ